MNVMALKLNLGGARADYFSLGTQGSAYAPPWARSNVTPLGFKTGPDFASALRLRRLAMSPRRSSALLRG